MQLREQKAIAPGWEPLLRQHNLASVEEVYRLNTGQVITRSGSTEVRRVELGAGPDARIVYLKKYWARDRASLWRGMFRGTFFARSKVRREYDNLLRLRAWQLDAPAPVAWGEERRGGWLMRSFLISEGVPEPLPLHRYIREGLPALPAPEGKRQRTELIARLAQYTRRMHQTAFVHHDYFWRNILLSHRNLERFFLIDAHKGRTWWPGGERRGRALDLAALDAPAPAFFRRSERLRFFLNYREHRRLDPEDKALIRLTLRLAGPMRENQLRRALGAKNTRP